MNFSWWRISIEQKKNFKKSFTFLLFHNLHQKSVEEIFPFIQNNNNTIKLGTFKNSCTAAAASSWFFDFHSLFNKINLFKKLKQKQQNNQLTSREKERKREERNDRVMLNFWELFSLKIILLFQFYVYFVYLILSIVSSKSSSIFAIVSERNTKSIHPPDELYK